MVSSSGLMEVVVRGDSGNHEMRPCSLEVQGLQTRTVVAAAIATIAVRARC